MPEHLDIKTDLKGKIRVTELSTKKVLSHKVTGAVIRIAVPEAMRKTLAAGEATVFKVTG